jgi:hypothetical protein
VLLEGPDRSRSFLVSQSHKKNIHQSIKIGVQLDIFMHINGLDNPPDAREPARKFVRKCSKNKPNHLALTVGLGGVVALVDDEVLRPVVLATGEVLVEDGLGAVGVALVVVSKLIKSSGYG